MKKLWLFVVFALALVSPAYGGHYVLKYESKGIVSLALDDSRSGSVELIFQLLPLTGDYSPGAAIVRLDGQPIWQTDGSSYLGSVTIPETGEIPVLDGTKLLVPNVKQPKAAPIQVSRRWFLVKHQIEVYFLATDGRGRSDKNHSAAPATQFTIEPIDPPTAATTLSGSPLSADQLDAVIKQSYEQGAVAGKTAWEKEREQLFAELQKATDELNELRRKAATRGDSKPGAMPSAVRYLPVKWAHQTWPEVGDEMLLVDSRGKVVARAKVVEVLPQLRRIWVSLTLPIDFDVHQGYTIQRPTGRGDK
ncbi:MAG: hypothetical protein AAB774_03040 [Patescibacteria group bacterium]